MYFDEYYVSGPKIKKLFSSNFFRFDSLNILSLSRLKLIDNKNKNSDKKNIICLPPPILDENTRINYGDIFSQDKIKNFYEIVFKLSKSFPNHIFWIKNKFTHNNLFTNEFGDYLKKLNVKNISILEDKKKNSLYKLIKNAQLLFGNYSSFFDECFSVNEKILLYDKDFSAFDHPLKSTNIFCNDFFEIEQRMNLMLLDKFNYDIKTSEIKNDYFPTFKKNSTDVYSHIISRINDIIFLK